MAKREHRRHISAPTNPVTGAGPIPGSPGYGPTGYPRIPRRQRKSHRFFKQLLRHAPPFLSDMGMFNQAQATINQILANQGKLPPEILARQQAALEAQRQNASRTLAQRIALTGGDPGSIQSQVAMAGVQQGADRAQMDARFQNAMAAEQQKRSDLNLVIPWMQNLMGYTMPKSRQVITPAPMGEAPKTDWASIGSNLLGSYISGAAPKGAGDSWNWGFGK
jgi:hypothetical protein